MENDKKRRFNYIFERSDRYATLALSLPCKIEQALCVKEEGKAQPKRPPTIAVTLFLYLIGKTQILNYTGDGDEASMNHIRSSVRDIAEETGYSKNTIQKYLYWLKDHGWLEIIVEKSRLETTYKLPIKKINDVILGVP